MSFSVLQHRHHNEAHLSHGVQKAKGGGGGGTLLQVWWTPTLSTEAEKQRHTFNYRDLIVR